MKFMSEIPSAGRPLYIIGAGGIVNDAHLPAYKLAGFDVKAIYDIERTKAAATAERFAIPKLFDSLEEMIAATDSEVIFDVAVPASQLESILETLPDGSAVLMQKPMGENLAAASRILELTRRKKMMAAVNFQLRYAPFIVELRRMVDEGMLGEVYDVEINVNVYTPWHLWDFLYKSPRVEILYHSIHYVDLVRSFLGNPVSMYAKSTKHPAMKELATVRSNIIMDYGDLIRANILTNHCHNYGHSHQQSYIKFEGAKGAVRINFGLLKNYPAGEPDKFEYTILKDGQPQSWQTKKVEGTWFPHAFAGSMAELMLAKEGKKAIPGNSVEDAIHTMACVEAAYESSESGGTIPKYYT
jgi:predicted dehydrogenase